MSISRFYSIPRFAMPYTVGDFAAGFHAIFQDCTPPESFAPFGDRPKFWARSGRQALQLLLSALDLKPGSGIAVPLFTDPSLFRAIVAAGHKPVFIDIDPRYLTIDPGSLKDAHGMFSAVVAVHLFGHVADIPGVIAAAPDQPIIEDTAHAPLSFLNSQMAGEFGVASFYSFASTKYWPAGGGGLGVVNDPTMARNLAGPLQLLSPQSRFQELQNIILVGAKAAVFHRRLYGGCGRPLRPWLEKWALLEPQLDLQAIQRSWAAIACRQAMCLPARVDEQRTISLQLLTRLADAEDVVLPYERPGAQYNRHLFPVLLHTRDERKAIMKALWAKFIDVSMIYSEVVKEARQFGYEGYCPVAESVANRLITLPNYAGLTDEDIETIAQTFLTSLRTYREARLKSERSRESTTVTSSL